MTGRTGLRKKTGKCIAVIASVAMVFTSIPTNYKYAKADSVQTNSGVIKIASETPMVEKNASDVAVLKKIIAEQKERGASVSDDLDDYGWNEIDGEMRLTAIDLGEKRLKGKISFAGLSELDYLVCHENELTELDVSDNTKLEYLIPLRIDF